MKNKNRIAIFFSLAILLCVGQTHAMLNIPQQPTNFFVRGYNTILNKMRNLFTTPDHSFSTTTPLFQKGKSLEANSNAFLEGYSPKYDKPLSIKTVENELEKKHGSFELDNKRNFNDPKKEGRYQVLDRELHRDLNDLKEDARILKKYEYERLKKEGVSPVLEKYLKDGGDPNGEMDTVPLLIKEAREGNTGNVKLLLTYGAFPSITDGSNGTNAATAAIKWGMSGGGRVEDRDNILDLLFRYGFNANNIRGEENPLLYVINNCDKIPHIKLIIEKFIENGTDPDFLGITELLNNRQRNYTDEAKYYDKLLKLISERGESGDYNLAQKKYFEAEILTGSLSRFMEALEKAKQNNRLVLLPLDLLLPEVEKRWYREAKAAEKIGMILSILEDASFKYRNKNQKF